jgi:hypothetical protein
VNFLRNEKVILAKLKEVYGLMHTCNLLKTPGLILFFFFTLLINELSQASTRGLQSLITSSTSSESRYIICSSKKGMCEGAKEALEKQETVAILMRL